MQSSESAKLHPSFDLIAVGSGAGGLTAAITVAEHGGRALVIEKDSCLGGVTALSQGQVWLGATRLEQEAGIDDSIEDTIAYLGFLSSGLADEKLQRSYAERGNEVIEFLREKAGVEFMVVRNYPDYFFPKAPGSKAEGRYVEVAPFRASRLGELRERFVGPSPFGMDRVGTPDLVAAAGDPAKIAAAAEGRIARDELCAGAALSASLVLAAAERGIEMRTRTRAVRLIRENGRIAGVEVETAEGTQVLRTRAVLLATGGYDWNLEFVRSFEHLPRLESMAPTTVEGDHITMATEVGAMVASARPESTPLNLGFAIPGQEHNGLPMFQGLAGAKPGGIIVNSAGQRFADESFYHDVNGAFAHYDGVEQRRPNQPAWLVFDSTYLPTYGLQTLPPGEPLPEGLATVADDLASLAKAAGIDSDGLMATVERFNGFCARGRDEDFGRGELPWSRRFVGDSRIQPNPCLGPLAKPPFWAIPLTPVGTSLATAGLKVDAGGRVQSARGEAIPRLYAAGNAAARTDVTGYQSGIGNARGLLLGYLAALDVMAA
ncbi:FAD-dependent oxidoreductase [Streptomyces sp. NWU339]|uniref:FAD-dependent oxidoreductase n=1 Tax=Streptomyces sp. NWU339 TaxID=2185284 RepID=UPI0015E8213F|nr:FAD-dependent oxidoreductase [Streptomyces sp. NWU339]